MTRPQEKIKQINLHTESKQMQNTKRLNEITLELKQEKAEGKHKSVQTILNR